LPRTSCIWCSRRALQAFAGELQDYIARHGGASTKPYVEPLAAALGDLRAATA
jgi:hypothetical protein